MGGGVGCPDGRPDSLFPPAPAGTQLEKLMESMRGEIAGCPPVEGAYTPRRGDFCIAKFVDGEWYAQSEKRPFGHQANPFLIRSLGPTAGPGPAVPSEHSCTPPTSSRSPEGGAGLGQSGERLGSTAEGGGAWAF